MEHTEKKKNQKGLPMGDERGGKLGENGENIEMEMREGSVWVEGDMEEGGEDRGRVGRKKGKDMKTWFGFS